MTWLEFVTLLKDQSLTTLEGKAKFRCMTHEGRFADLELLEFYSKDGTIYFGEMPSESKTR